MTSPAPQLRLVEPDDPDLDMAALRRGDAAAMAACYAQHARRLRTIALRFTASMPDAEDIVHDVFARLPDALETYHERGQFSGWLTTLVIRESLGHVRATRARRAAPLDEASGAMAPTVDGDPLAGRRIVAALAELSPALRAVFVLRAVHDHTHAEIGRLLDISPNTSEVRMHRAVQQLRTQLGSLR